MSKKKTHKQSKQKNRRWPAFLAALVVIIVSIILFYPSETSRHRQNIVSVAPEPPSGKLARANLFFIGKDGQQKAGLIVEIAENDYQRSKGLMFRRDLAENQGMLFIFEQEEPQAFWMKNTPLALDMIFVNARKEIVQIHKYTTPFSTQTYFSGKPARFVVETVAGFTDRYQIQIGDQIEWQRLSAR